MKRRFIPAVVLLLSAVNACAQSDRASITGTVRDTSGAVIEGAQVTVADAATSIQESAATNEFGVYRFRNLPIGEYRLECSKAEFGNYGRSGINLAISQVAEIDIVLRIGANAAAVCEKLAAVAFRNTLCGAA